MRKTPEQVKKLIDAYLTADGVHKYPIVEISHDVLSAYDGDCPRFIIKYDAKKSDYDDTLGYDLTNKIEKFTTLKHNRDYVLGYQWSWNS